MIHSMECQDGTARVILADRLTYADHERFRTLIDTLHRSDAARWQFELSRLDFVDSAGVNMLMVARKAAEETGAAVEFRSVGERVRRICRAIGLNSLLPDSTTAA